ARALCSERRGHGGGVRPVRNLAIEARLRRVGDQPPVLLDLQVEPGARSGGVRGPHRSPPLDEPEDGVRPALADLLPPLAVDGTGGEGEEESEERHAESEEPGAPESGDTA